MNSPDKKTYLELSSKYNLIPVYREYMADTETPTSIFLKSCGMESVGFLLESIEGAKNLSRYSFIGIGCSSRAVLYEGLFRYEKDGLIEKEKKTENPLREVEDIMKGLKLYKDPALKHFIGGAVGYLSYDLVKYFDNIQLPGEKADFPEMLLCFTDLVVVFDHLMNRLKIISTICTGQGITPEDAYELSVERIESLERKITYNTIPSLSTSLRPRDSTQGTAGGFQSNFSPGSFRKAVDSIRKKIIEGE